MNVDRLALLQATYYLLSGLWPLVHMRSFIAITGPKTDRWLVHAFGLLVIGFALPLAAIGMEGSAETIRWFAVSMAAALIGADVAALVAGMRPVYAADAVLEAVFIGMWSTLAW